MADPDPVRIMMSRQMGADAVFDFNQHDVVEEIKHMTGGRGVDVAIEALGTQATFENALRVLRPGGTLSSLGVYSGKLSVPMEAFDATVQSLDMVFQNAGFTFQGWQDYDQRLWATTWHANFPTADGRSGSP